ncbi:autotransporter outer membrane beta-barrel domain-containing protein [Fusobacterium varium]|uniref:autotransporter outer membrane beta-barrel domain-containing protein n=2 Tax=Fusobacterium varium TaxID=856 RepID=UPI0024308506|nr:autotransporter outer membrane beta-barrel domain-containing protein [Fusobacterium varium]MCI6033336.1 autotransporter outer membrane beta-barrel domain-containing protein [Fusobacterium varium]
MGKKTKIILGILAIFMIVGNIGYGESLTEEKEDINISKDIGLEIKNSNSEIKGKNITIEGTEYNGMVVSDNSKIILEGEETVKITGKGNGIYFEDCTGEILGKDINIKGSDYNGIFFSQGSIIDVKAEDTLNITGGYNGIYLEPSGTGNLQGKNINISGDIRGIFLNGNGTINLTGESTSIVGREMGILIENGGKSQINSNIINLSGETEDGILVNKEGSIVEIVGKNTFISGYQNGIMALARGEVIINSDEVSIRSNSNQSNQGNAIYTVDEGSVEITANNTNIYSEYIGIHAQTGEIIINSSGKNEIKGEENGVYATAITYADSMNTEIGDIKISGKLNQISGKEGVTVVGGEIEINSTEKTIILGETRGVHANSPGGKIDISSLNTIIKAQAENGVGIEASTGADLNIDSTNTIIFGKKYSIYAESTQKPSDATLSEITLSENGSHEIYGNIKSHGNTSIKIGGKGNKISSSSDNKPLIVTATKGGKIDISLVDGILTGIVDDGRAADANGGTISLNLDNGTWKTQGKSFVTSIDLRNNGNIIFTEEGTSVDIENLSGDGNGTFGMTVNAINKSEGNMLYVQESNGGIYNVALQNSNLEDIKIGERIRFATIGNNAKTNNLGFKVLDIKERGIRDINFKVEKEKFDKNDSENEIYNGGQTPNDKKPGNGYVVDNYQDGENWYLTRNSSGNINDIGTAIMEAAKSNYANAVYMDNLNKRLGDMSFADGESGLWVRMRNDKVGEDNHYKLHNYMTQIGYDKSYSMENGIEHRGIAFEYGKGDMKYKELKGNTDTDKYILTLYKTKVRDNKVYTDYTLRGGAISNDFTVYGRETGAKVTGKYKNMVLGAGTEVGKRYELDKNWYIEPQAQLQYTYINSTDYTTNQMTKVDLDEIHSLIGRAGIKLGHDSYKGNKKDNTVYVKADINHEFLGEQNVKAKDETGRLDKTYKNNETWVEIGIGASKKITPDLNVYADVEKQLGSNKDNKNWQVNVGFRYKF